MTPPASDDPATAETDESVTADASERESADADGSEVAAADEMYCHDCGALIAAKAEICPACGVRQRDPPGSTLDALLADLTEGGNPFVAAVASAILPGLGQLYNRKLERGIAVMAAAFFAALSTLVFVGILLYPIVWLWAIYDAYKGAERYAADAAER